MSGGGMSETIVLKMVDELTAPARRATAAAKKLLTGLQALGKASLKASGVTKDLSRLTAEMEKTTKAAKTLRDAMSRPLSDKMGSAGKTFTSMATEADKANAAVRRLNQSFSRQATGGGNTRGAASVNHGIPNVRLNRWAGANGPWGAYRPPAPPRIPRAGSGGIGGAGGNVHGGGGSSFFGGMGHIGNGIASTFAHVGVYEAVHRGIHGIAEIVKGGFESAFEADHVRALLTVQGESRDLIDKAQAQARSMTAEMPQFTSAQNFAAIAELKPALIGGLEEAIKLAPLFQKSVAVLEAVKVGGQHKAMSGIDAQGEALDLVRAVELKGVMKDGDEAVKGYVNSMTQAIIAFNGQIKAGDFHSAIKMAGSAARPWTEEFTTQYLPTIINDLKTTPPSKRDGSYLLASNSNFASDSVGSDYQ